MFEKLDDVPTHCYNMSRRYNTSVRSSYDDESCSIRHWTDVPRPPSKVYPLPTGPIPRAVEGG